MLQKFNRYIVSLFVPFMAAALLTGCGSIGQSSDNKNASANVPEVTTDSESTSTLEDKFIARKFEFYSDSKDVYYVNLDKLIRLDGKTYELTTDVRYEVTGTREVVESVIDLSAVELDEIADTFTYKSPSGKEYILHKEQVYIKEEGIVEYPYTETVVYEDVVGKPSVKSKKTITNKNSVTGETQELQLFLISLEETTKGAWKSVLEVDGEFVAPDEETDTYVLTGVPNVKVKRDAATPEWENYKQDVLRSLGLNSKYYRIDSCAWNGDSRKADGKYIRDAVFHGQAYVSTYTATYEGTELVPGYSTKVYYRIDASEADATEEDITTVYKIICNARYKLIEG